MNNKTILKITNLQKYYGDVHAVEDVSIDIKQGEIFGFLGPNGAGKTTTIAMILGLIYPTHGQIEVCGQTVSPLQSKALINVGALVGASPAIIPYLSVKDNLKLIARIHPEIKEIRIQEVINMVKLSDASNRKASKLSTGMKQRLGIAMALLHHPRLLILDEPTNGMDPVGMREMRILLKKLADDGVTIFLSSHLLHEVEQVCDRVAFLNKGHIIAQGDVTTLINNKQGKDLSDQNALNIEHNSDLESVFFELTQVA